MFYEVCIGFLGADVAILTLIVYGVFIGFLGAEAAILTLIVWYSGKC
jgi:hypothetical protein